MWVTRRGVQIALGLLWVLDGALQLQPYMLGPGFAHGIIAAAAQGQPVFVAAGVHWASSVIAAHPAAWDVLFAAVQLALGVGLLVRPFARLALAGSIVWALGVWYVGEGLGGLASGRADLLTGFPGAVLLYAVLAAAAWPNRPEPRASAWRRLVGGRADLPPRAWLAAAWAVLWISAALLRMDSLDGRMLAGEITRNAAGAPSWLAHFDHGLGQWVAGGGVAVAAVLVVIEMGVALGGLAAGTPRTIAAWTGITLAALFWIAGQDFGELYSGRATDPNTAPLIVLFAVALLGSPVPAREAGQTPSARPGRSNRRDGLPVSHRPSGAGEAEGFGRRPSESLASEAHRSELS